MYENKIEIVNKRIVIIGFYYGKFPEWMEYWLRSCADNPTIDFFLITDIKIEDLPTNVKIIHLTIGQVKQLFEEKLKFNISLNKPYKLCDYRPLYGVLLHEYIKEYDYWGHCDFDLIWGDIRKFVDKYDFTHYDKFLSLGHLSLYRNTNKVNNYYKLDGSNCGDYRTVLMSEDNFAFDETGGIYAIYEHNHLPMFTKRIFAEIKMYHRRFRLKKCDRNYKHQVFYYEKGNVYRAYEENGIIKTEDYIYIHFRRKLLVNENKKWKDLSAFYISPNGFFEKQSGKIPDINEIEKFNHNPGLIKETLETIVFCLKNITKIKTKVENEIITHKGNKK